ncbi:uncharacterized protein [Argopecten irradians]|uniref:uncharacterized protein n=1 Tax=Argopecten irradians TaxID=31199 RepID=UPI0037107E8D
MTEEIDDPADFILHHKLAPQNLIIVDVEVSHLSFKTFSDQTELIPTPGEQGAWFQVIHSFKDNTYRIISIQDVAQKVLYMDGDNLKTRDYKPMTDINSRDTMFNFMVMGNNCWEIVAIPTGHVLRFDLETGEYLPEEKRDQVSPPIFCNPDIGPGFQMYSPKSIKVTTV